MSEFLLGVFVAVAGAVVCVELVAMRQRKEHSKAMLEHQRFLLDHASLFAKLNQDAQVHVAEMQRLNDTLQKTIH